MEVVIDLSVSPCLSLSVPVLCIYTVVQGLSYVTPPETGRINGRITNYYYEDKLLLYSILILCKLPLSIYYSLYTFWHALN